jgi:hypothetical protein
MTTIDNLEVLTDRTSFEVDDSKTKITAKICWVVGNVYFPEQDWNDFVLILSKWWLDSLTSLQTQKMAAFRFMDGPFSIICSRQDELVHLRLQNSSTCVAKFESKFSVLKAEVEINAKLVYDYCVERRVCGRDFESLRDSLKSLS